MNPRDLLYNSQLRLRQRIAALRCGSHEGQGVPLGHSFEPSKVLFVLSGLIGDSVMSLPAIEAARRLWPRARIAGLGKRHNRELIEGCGFFDEFHQCDADPFSLRRSSEIDGLAGWLRGSGFDAAFILLGDQYAHLLAAAGIPVRVGVKGTPLESCLTHVYEIGSPRTWGPSERLNALRCIGFEVEDSVPVLTAWPSAVSSARAWLAELGMLAAGGFVVLHPFGSTRRQWWDLANAERLAEKVRQKHGLTTVLIGKDRVGTRSGDGLINAAGELSLPETIALIGDARAVISTDSGPFHIAGAMRRPVIGLFRSRRPEHAGRYPNAKAIFGEDSRCERTCQWDRCASAPCRQMAAIPVDAALTILDQKLHDL